MCVDYARNVIAGGSYYGSIGTFGNVVLPIASNADALVWKLTVDGTTLWALRGGGQYADEVRSVAVDHTGAVYATGNVQFSGSNARVTFGHVSVTRSSNFMNKPFLWKVNGAGTTMWAIVGDGASDSYDTTNAVSVDITGNVFVAGRVRSASFTFGGSVAASANGETTMWKFNQSGVGIWNAQILDGYNVMDVTADATGGAAAMFMRDRTAVLWKVNAQGTTAWSVVGGGTTSNDPDDLHMGEAR